MISIDASVGKFLDFARLLDVDGNVNVRIRGEICAVLDARLQDFPHCCAGLHLVFAQAVDFRIARVGDHDALVGVVQANALRHVAKGGVEARIDQFEFGGLLLDKLGLRALDRDVLMDADPAAIRNRGLDDGDNPAVLEIGGGLAFAGLAQFAAEFVDEAGYIQTAVCGSRRKT